MLRLKGVYPFQMISALCRNSAKQTCLAPVSNYHILTASARTHGHNNVHFILTSWSNRVNNKHDGYQYKAPSKAAEIHTLSKNNLCVSITPTISCHCSCLLASFAKGKNKEINKNNNNLLTKNILSREGFVFVFFFFNIRDDTLLLDLIPKMNIFLEYLTVHKSTKGYDRASAAC